MNKAIVAGTVGVVLGGVAGYLLGRRDLKKRLENEYAELAFQDIQGVKEHYKQLHKEDEYADPTLLAVARGILEEEDYIKVEFETADEVADELLERLNHVDELLKEPDGELEGAVKVHNLFAEHDEERESLRAEGKPYIISIDEIGEQNYDTYQLTYFEEDDVLVDEHGQPVSKVDETVGRANLSRFGELDDDPNIMYIRNETSECEFEVAKEEGSYARTYLGVEPEPPKTKRRTRPRPSDDEE